MLDQVAQIVGAQNVATGGAAERWSRDWTGNYQWNPLGVARPGSVAEVSEIVKWANATRTPVVPISGGTGLAGGCKAEGALMISTDRMNRIRDLRPAARIAIVEAGVILNTLHDAATEHDLTFPMTFGARGSCMIGGMLATNAGGSNVLRYGNARDLVLGIEAVLPTGEILNAMTELHKDNTGYNLKHLLIGAEGTLGIITAAVLKLVPRPRAYATAMVAAPSLDGALELLNRLQEATGGRVEAFEYMPRAYVVYHRALYPDAKEPFDAPHAVNILVEIASTMAEDCTPGPDGSVPLGNRLEQVLGALFETGHVVDAVVAQSEAQRREMWARREAAGMMIASRVPSINTDVAVPVDKVPEFLRRADALMPGIDPGFDTNVVSHLGDGNVHYSVFPASQDPDVHDRIMEAIEDVALQLGGSFSAEHGIGVAKLGAMRRRKDPVALAAMRAIKAALDPNGILNPGKVLP